MSFIFEFIKRTNTFRKEWAASSIRQSNRLLICGFRVRFPGRSQNRPARKGWTIFLYQLNIAESNGRWHKGEKRQFFWIARGSVYECVPIIQVLYRKQLINKEKYTNYYEQLDVMAKMLTNLVKSVETLREKIQI